MEDPQVEVGPDVPSHEEAHEPTTFERWRATYLEGPGAMPAACIAALADGEVVGYTRLCLADRGEPADGCAASLAKERNRRRAQA